MADKTRALADGIWLPADAIVPATVNTEVAIGRELAVTAPERFFGADPTAALWSVQALAANTRRAYRSDWSAFLECCRLHGHVPLPTSPSAVETFIEWRSPGPLPGTPEKEKPKFYRHVLPAMPRRPVTAAALRRALAAIAAVHRWLRCPDPTEDEDVKAALRINVAGRQVQSQKKPLRWEDLERAFARMGEGSDLWALRDKALVSVAHSTMFRRGELVALDVRDYIREEGAEDGRMIEGKTKASDPKDQRYRHVAPEAVQHLEAWLATARITSGPLFRGVTPDGRVKAEPLSAGAVARAFKAIGRLAGLDPSGIAGHSTRIGATHDLKLFGADTLDIMQEGGWQSPMMPKRYLQGLESDLGAMARMARARQRDHRKGSQSGRAGPLLTNGPSSASAGCAIAVP